MDPIFEDDKVMKSAKNRIIFQIVTNKYVVYLKIMQKKELRIFVSKNSKIVRGGMLFLVCMYKPGSFFDHVNFDPP